MFIISRSINSLADLIVFIGFCKITSTPKIYWCLWVTSCNIQMKKKKTVTKEFTRYTLGCLMKELFSEKYVLYKEGREVINNAHT